MARLAQGGVVAAALMAFALGAGAPSWAQQQQPVEGAVPRAPILTLDRERILLESRFGKAVEAQFRDLSAYSGGPEPVTPLLLGCFDSQSTPNGHLGTRGGEDQGTVEGCCLNGGARALALAWEAIVSADESGVTAHLRLSRDAPAAEVIGFEPFEATVITIYRIINLSRGTCRALGELEPELR